MNLLDNQVTAVHIFNKLESKVSSYCKSFPEVFHRAKGSLLYTKEGEAYIDFLMGAGALNYGHNNDYIKQQVLGYIQSDGLVQGLDLFTHAKKDFISYMNEKILVPRNMNYKFMFCGPTGTNAVEAALKLARKNTKRTGIFAFMGGYHGMTLGSLAVTSNAYHRHGAGVHLDNVTFIPYEMGCVKGIDTIKYIEGILKDGHSGIDKPAAIILETIQAEGGVYVSSPEWLQAIRRLCDEHDILLIVDDIQAGCGRSGDFFSFERAGIQPDIITLSKSISGYGFPLSMVLLKPDLDIWKPAEHNGTFRGHQLSFIGGKAGIEYYHKFELEKEISIKANLIHKFLSDEIAVIDNRIKIRGLGMIWGIDFSEIQQGVATRISKRCFEEGLIIECTGRAGAVIKLLPALTISTQLLNNGLAILKAAIAKEFAIGV